MFIKLKSALRKGWISLVIWAPAVNLIMTIAILWWAFELGRNTEAVNRLSYAVENDGTK